MTTAYTLERISFVNNAFLGDVSGNGPAFFVDKTANGGIKYGLYNSTSRDYFGPQLTVYGDLELDEQRGTTSGTINYISFTSYSTGLVGTLTGLSISADEFSGYLLAASVGADVQDAWNSVLGSAVGVWTGTDGIDQLDDAVGFITDVPNFNFAGGNDTFEGRLGDMSNATLDGGDGVDTISDRSYWSYSDVGRTSVVAVNFETGRITTDSSSTFVVNFENFENFQFFNGSPAAHVTGDANANRLIGGDASDILRGGLGDDFLGGSDGQDQLFGGGGNDAIDGGLRDDTLWGGAGDDILNGGGASDTIFSDGGNDTIYGGSDIDERNYNNPIDVLIMRGESTRFSATQTDDDLVLSDGHFAVTIKSSVERIRFDDVEMTFAEAHNLVASQSMMIGTAEGELFVGTNGADWFDANGGNDTVEGGFGRDMVSFAGLAETPGREGSTFRLDVDLQAGIALNHDGTERTEFTSVERVTGSIYADVLRGTDGDDELRGIGDYDWFIATTGNDTLDGGNGLDMITFLEAQSSGATAQSSIFEAGGVPPLGAGVEGVLLNLGDPSQSSGLAQGLTLNSIERVTGSSFQDVFYGDDQQNDFRGLGGFDWFVSSGGGRERYFGGAGDDTVTYFNASAGITASLSNGRDAFNGQSTGFGSAGDALRDLYFEIENLVGTHFDDNLTGSDDRNQLSGLDGDDFIFGKGGTDYMKGGKGNDTIDGGAGSDFALYDGNLEDYTLTRTSATEVTVTHQDGNDSLNNVQYFQFDDVTANIWDLAIV